MTTLRAVSASGKGVYLFVSVTKIEKPFSINSSKKNSQKCERRKNTLHSHVQTYVREDLLGLFMFKALILGQSSDIKKIYLNIALSRSQRNICHPLKYKLFTMEPSKQGVIVGWCW